MKTNLISGRPLLGFWFMFEQCYGDPETESPMRTITPSCVGGALLPFRCPRCQDVARELASPKTREWYRDTRKGRDNHFCPSCGCRFKINMEGMELPCALEKGAMVAPSKVECGGEVAWQDMGAERGVAATVLGFLISASARSGYQILARM